ncbi:hypothetical protein [Pseudosulfitobacter pseudonitzschiae]|uniref:hypothetical protein n=1 Tax=Pseudosulfitobacter pseudonitzschiae TaxID=1402135 RepID=UPI001AF18164|nr:hypothetical protein [Pseudosulfitobacter pseudonitzschiae]MBM1815961.1 hypothetical protein [Pseudosulfitobacter pseudonitzschiae]MBM1833267.1 hypothetical protein [Pseudosulfitobacter pseudonitzschiae]MBM1838135.1 hypothetical protein [Pseudosulfitobacter pseudonitzschiae]MBM1842666.1 hypothetical protein [Pseudosulfitobacter pseudonitzschiae]MBM1847533.1 hypothetical protein [Pseudosulfitobacter pseudonitzschiae]
MDQDLSVSLDDHRNLLLTEISRRTFEEQSLTELDNDYGLFVVLEDTLSGKFDVLAKVASASAGVAMIEMFTRAAAPLHSV